MNTSTKHTRTTSAELKPEHVIAIVDTRERTPLDLSPLQSVAGTLATGDYTVKGLEQAVAIERKSLPDMLACVGVERARFDREIQRLLAYQTRALVVEATWPDLEAGDWRSRVTPAAAIGSCLGWIAAGIPLVMAGDHTRAGKYVARLLFLAARRRWRELRSLDDAVRGTRMPTRSESNRSAPLPRDPYAPRPWRGG